MAIEEQNESTELVGSYEEPDYAEIVTEQTMERPEPTPPAEETPPAVGAQAAPEITPPTTPAAEPTAPPSQPAAAAPEPAAAPSVPAQPGAPAESAEAMRARYEKLLADIDTALLAQYSYNPEEAGKLDDLSAKPSEYLPKMAAELHKRVYMAAMESVAQQIPQFVEGVLQQKQTAEAAENSFFSRWPELKGKDEIVLQAIKTYRQANPQEKNLQTIIERAGAFAMINAGLNPMGNAQPPAAPTPQFAPPRPAMPGSGGPQAPVGAREPSYEEKVFSDMVSEHFNS